MPEYLHSPAWLRPGDSIVVSLDAPANVMLLDDAGFEAYQKGTAFSYLGGWVSKARITLWPPREDRWHVVIDVGGKEGRVSAAVQVLRG